VDRDLAMVFYPLRRSGRLRHLKLSYQLPASLVAAHAMKTPLEQAVFEL
jgi:hypothetical protein